MRGMPPCARWTAQRRRALRSMRATASTTETMRHKIVHSGPQLRRRRHPTPHTRFSRRTPNASPPTQGSGTLDDATGRWGPLLENGAEYRSEIDTEPRLSPLGSVRPSSRIAARAPVIIKHAKTKIEAMRIAASYNVSCFYFLTFMFGPQFSDGIPVILSRSELPLGSADRTSVRRITGASRHQDRVPRLNCRRRRHRHHPLSPSLARIERSSCPN